ncbi:MAG: hypothetical protein R6W72_02370 [Desulfurivibrionaceae bacterium]
MIKVIVAGAAGRMGRRITHMVEQHPDLELVGGFEQEGNLEIGKDLGELAGIGKLGVNLSAGLAGVIEQGDVIIDFTFHESTMKFARLAAEHKKAMVIGTTGLSPENLAELSHKRHRLPPSESGTRPCRTQCQPPARRSGGAEARRDASVSLRSWGCTPHVRGE